MGLLGRYKNGNFVTTILSDGTKIRETKDDEFIPTFAELYIHIKKLRLEVEMQPVILI